MTRAFKSVSGQLSVVLLSALLLGACATRPHTYATPDPGRLNSSTARVSKAVTAAHTAARKAQTGVTDAVAKTKEIADETRKLKDVPVTLVAKINELDVTLHTAQVDQVLLEKQLAEADAAKAQVEKDKNDYFDAARKLADNATEERDKRIKVEKALSWYRWHWWGSWIVLGLGVLACGLIAFLKFTGKLALAGAAISAKIP